MKEKMMLFSERMLFADALTRWREQQMQKIGWRVKDAERLKMYYNDCISALVGLELVDIEKSRLFIAEMEGEDNDSE